MKESAGVLTIVGSRLKMLHTRDTRRRAIMESER